MQTIKYKLPGYNVTYDGGPELRREAAQEAPPLQLLARQRPIYALMLGDSMTSEIRRRKGTQREVRRRIDRVEFIGTRGTNEVTGGFFGDLNIYSWEHDGIGGERMVQIAARVPTIASTLAADGIPVDIVILLAGTNDLLQLYTSAVLESNARTMLDAVRAAWPDAWIVWAAPPPVFGVTYTSAQALRQVFVQQVMPKILADHHHIVMVDGFSSMTEGEASSDNIHPLEVGYLRSCVAEAEAVAAIVGPRQIIRELDDDREDAYTAFDYQAISIVTPTSSVATAAANVNLSPEDQSFAVALRFVVDAMPTAGSVFSLVQMGNGLADGYMIGVAGITGSTRGGLSYYQGGDGSPVMSGQLGYGAGANNMGLITPGVEHEVFVLSDRPHNKVCIGLDGRIVAIVDLVNTKPGHANWNLQVHQTRFGRASLNGVQARLRRFQFYKGANVPNFHHFPRFCAEKWRYGILPPGLLASYPMSEGTGSPAEVHGNAGALTLSGGAVWDVIYPPY